MLDPIHVQQLSNTSTTAQKKAIEQGREKEQGFDFEDVLDIFNPLQHIPIVSNIYQEQTQDDISNDAKAVGDVLYGILTGGVFGVLSAVGNAILKQETDKDVGEHLMAFFDEEENQIPLTDSLSDKHVTGLDEIPIGNKVLDNSTAVVGNTVHSYQNVKNAQEQLNEQQQMSQKDDYWSLRMKQIFGDDEDFG